MRQFSINTSGGKTVFLDSDFQDRVQQHSPEYINESLRSEARNRIESLSHQNKNDLTERIEDLDKEWDIDRALLMVFSVLGGAALWLGLKKDRRFLSFLGVQIGFLGYHAMAGWCPPVSALRRMRFRTQKEIDAEKYALKTLRGDFAK